MEIPADKNCHRSKRGAGASYDLPKNKSLSSMFLILWSLALGSGAALAQSAGPQPLPLPAQIASPKDAPYAGAIRLTVDATDIERNIFNVHESIPVRPGEPIVLLYPQWLPGTHSPSGSVDNLAGLMIYANGARVEWQRDPVNVFAFHVDVPVGASVLDVNFQVVSPVVSTEGRVVMTPDMLNLQWNAVVLYPAGYFARQIMTEPTVRFPEGWEFATALETVASNGGLTTFKPVSLDTLVDSPIFAGRYFKRLDLDPRGHTPVHLNIVADRPELLEVKPEQLEAHRALVQQAYKLYGSQHYDHYDFLLALTDQLGDIGLEHHQSSEDGTVPDYFTGWDTNAAERDLLPHEYTHSWNGKFRRPADLWTPNFNVPMRDSLLWVYEGQTQYWGFILAARAGLLTKQQTLDALAWTAAVYDHRIGREWRALQDTTNDPIETRRAALPWRSWERGEDYYSEGLLIWLDADTLIREQSRGQRSLDDFAHLFFGVNDGSFVPSTYVFEDVVQALNTVQAHDWFTFLRTRLDGHGPGAPLDGIARGGYKLVYSETPSDYFKESEKHRKVTDLSFSLGMTIAAEGQLNDVVWEGPAYKSRLTVGTQIVAVNGTEFDPSRLKSAITDAKKSGAAIELLVKNGDRYRTVSIDYHDGLRYPHLERDESTPARLDQILAPRN
jgi:predicted metalloprotease with PDZ domain